MKKINDNKIYSANKLLIRVAISAVFLSFAIVVKILLSFYLPFLGTSGIKIDFSGVFSAFPAMIFGPIYGGIVFALADFIGFILKPTGAFLPHLTATQFLTGFLIGLLWYFLNSKNKRSIIIKVSAVTLCILFVLTGIFGIAFHISLKNDGISSSLIVKAEELPSKMDLDHKNISPLSYLARYLAKYNIESYIVLPYKGENTDEMIIPAQVSKGDGYDAYPVVEISDGFLSSDNSNADIYIPMTIKTIGKNAFGDNYTGTIHAPAGSYAIKFAQENNLEYKVTDFHEATEYFENEFYSFVSNGSYRRNLAYYINIVKLGSIISCFGGLLFLTIVIIIKKSKIGQNTNISGYIIIFISIFIPRFIVTTINTEILRRALAVWNGRAFMVLWVPRAAEEILTCVLQTYLIFILWTIYETNIRHKIKYL